MNAGCRQVNGERVLPVATLADHNGPVESAEALVLQEEQSLGRLLLLGVQQVLDFKF